MVVLFLVILGVLGRDFLHVLEKSVHLWCFVYRSGYALNTMRDVVMIGCMFGGPPLRGVGGRRDKPRGRITKSSSRICGRAFSKGPHEKVIRESEIE